jgi:phosphonopyruvate decarboxylase
MSNAKMDIAAACATLQRARNDELAVLTMSAIAYWDDVREDDYRLMGLMGSAGAIGLGLALGLGDRSVWVLDGDGSLLMQLGVTAAIGSAAPRNLTHVVFDNGIYAISGAQPTPSPDDWPGLLRAAGYTTTADCSTVDELATAVVDDSGEGPRAIVVRCEPVRPAYPAGAFNVNPRVEAYRCRAGLTSGRSARGAAMSAGGRARG